MAKRQYIPLDQWAESASDEKIEAATAAIRKKRNLWLIIWAIILVAFVVIAMRDSISDIPTLIISASLMLGIPAGFVNFCNNTLCIVKSRGRKANGGIMIFVFTAMGLFIIPALVTGICAKDRWTGARFVGIHKIINE